MSSKYKTLTGDPKKGAVPAGQYNVLETLMGEWEALVGFTVEPSQKQLLAMANSGVMTLADFSKYMLTTTNAYRWANHMPWARYGLSKEEYVTASTQFGTTYKGVTGQDISTAELNKAFQNRDPTMGGTLTASEYKQQLMNDAALQKQFGWIKYGMDFSAWTQQKLSMRGVYGRDINDSEAANILQYTKTASGANLGAVGRQVGQQVQPPSGAGVAGSLAR